MDEKDIEKANYDLITDLAPKVGMFKKYDYGYSSPASGMMILAYNGVNYMITATPLSRTEDRSISEELDRFRYKFEKIR